MSELLKVTEFLGKVVETEVSYTLIKTSITEDFSPESSYNVVISPKEAPPHRLKSNVVQVFSDPSALSRPVDELFRREAYAEALAKTKAKKETQRATQKAWEAAEAEKKLEEEVKKLSDQAARATSLAEEARENAEAAGSSVESFLNKAKNFSSGLSWEKLGSQVATAVQNPEEKPKVQIATVRGQAMARTLPSMRAVIKKPTPKPNALPSPKAKPNEANKEVRKVLGDLFKQETIYIDDD
ncbi:hypothetical protein HHK36_011058 [Tetracentron sinense]|uniref:Uncharacterized protein n=1 Tax=Tetracentron sinense TaxID=13715 RepID=A0A834Z9J9_TETSI|nr:hypothetical protein HHK36_011058 [Tetracentron sinense]